MPYIEIIEKDETSAGVLAESTDVVYIPGFVDVSQECLYVNGKYVGGVDPNRDRILLSPYIKSDVLHFQMEGYNRSKPDDERNPESLSVRGCRQIFEGAYICTINEDVQSLVYDFEILLDIAKSELFNEDYRAFLNRELNNAMNCIDFEGDELTGVKEAKQYIEDVIANIQPEEAEGLSFGDEDLQGIEAAMNNLLMRMRDTYRQQARFVNDASHELRTPIAVIEGYVNMLARWGGEDEKVLKESITALQREAGHMKHLVEQLLFLARGDSGKNKLEIEQISLNECMQEVYEESLLIDEQHVYRYRPVEEVQIDGDFMMLKQAVRILVDNAAKYTKENDEIILSIGRNEDGNAYLQVQDTGIGMAENDVEHMFERFYRADDARKYKGTGLGLSIAKWIVDKHGGHFEILSRSELGTRIRIVLGKNVSCQDG